MVRVFSSAEVSAMVTVVTPFASVAAGWVRGLPVPSDARETSRPGRGFPLASPTVTVTSVPSLPSALTPVVGLAEAVESVALMSEGSAMNPTVGC
jgi:hypothetical protein